MRYIKWILLCEVNSIAPYTGTSVSVDTSMIISKPVVNWNRCYVYRNGTQNADNEATTFISWSGVSYDTDEFWTVFNPTRLTAKRRSI